MKSDAEIMHDQAREIIALRKKLADLGVTEAERVPEALCLAPPKWRGSDGKCNSCLVCAPEKFEDKS